MTAPDDVPDEVEILGSHGERQAAMDAFKTAGRSDAWIHGWWRNQMRHRGG
jgi:hypothetical protein